MVTIYALTDPRTPWRIQYVGGTTDPVLRMNSHLFGWEQGYSHSIRLRDWFRSLRKVGVQPVMQVLECVEYHEASFVESAWIDLMSGFFPLLNCPRMGRTWRKGSDFSLDRNN